MQRVTLEQPSRLIINTSCESQTLPISCIHHISSNQIILLLDRNITISVEPVHYNSKDGSCPIDSPPLVLENLQDSGVESPPDSQRKGSVETEKNSESESSPSDPPSLNREESGNELENSSEKSVSADEEAQPESDCYSSRDAVCSDNVPDDERSECGEMASENLKRRRISSVSIQSEASSSNCSDSSNEESKEESISLTSNEVLYDSSFHDDHLLQTSRVTEKLDDSSEDLPPITEDDLRSKDLEDIERDTDFIDEEQIESEDDSSKSSNEENSDRKETESDGDQENEDDGSNNEGENVQPGVSSPHESEISDQEEANQRNDKRRFELMSASGDEDAASLRSGKSSDVDSVSRGGHDLIQTKRLRKSSDSEDQETDEGVDDEIEKEGDEEEGNGDDINKEEGNDNEEGLLAVSEDEEMEDSPLQEDAQSILMEESGSEPTVEDDDCLIVLSSDNEEEAIEVMTQSSRNYRSKSRRVLEEAELEKETNKATSAERRRNERVTKQEKRYKQLLQSILKSLKGPRLILDIDLETEKVRVEVDPILVQILKKYQRDGIKFLYNATIESVDKLDEGDGGSGCILAHCMGLGKTFQIIAFVHTLLLNRFTKKFIKTILIAVPVNTLKNWVDEVNKWITDKGLKSFHVHEIVNEKNLDQRLACLTRWSALGGVLIIGHSLLANLLNLQTAKRPASRSVIKRIERCLAAPGPDMVIIDEGHILKSGNSRICQAVGRMETQRKIMLTGTPLQNNLDEYHTMVNIIKPRLLGSKMEFANQFCNPIVNGQKADSNADDVRLMKQRATILHKLLSGCIQRFDYDTLRSHLEPKSEYALYIRASQRMAQMYNYYLSRSKCRQLFQDLAVLRLCVNHPALYQLRLKRGNTAKAIGPRKRRKLSSTQSTENFNDEEVDYDITINQNWYKKMVKFDDWKNIELSGKFVMLFKILRKCVEVNDKLVVVSQSLETLDLIEKYLQSNERLLGGVGFKNFQWKPNKHYLRIDGNTNVRGRDERIKQFNDPRNNDARVILLSTKAGGIGINLIAANRVIVFDVSWNPSHDNQAIFRVYRLGQNKPVYVYRFVTKDTIEEKIFRKQIFKIATSMRVVDKTQVKRTFTSSELEEFYKVRPKEHYEVVFPSVPKDRLLADLLHSNNKEVLECTEFSFLLEKKPEEELTEVERQAAWTEYQKKRDTDIQIIDEILNIPEDSTPQVQVKIEGIANEETNTQDVEPNNQDNDETAPTISETDETDEPLQTVTQSSIQVSNSSSESVIEIGTSPLDGTQGPTEINELVDTNSVQENEKLQQAQTDDTENSDCTSPSITASSPEQNSFQLRPIQLASSTSTNELSASKQVVWMEYRPRRLSLLSDDEIYEEKTDKIGRQIEKESISSKNIEKASACPPVIECREKESLNAVQSAAPEAERVDTQGASPAPPPISNESIIKLIDAFQKTQTSEVTMETTPEPTPTMSGDNNSSSHGELPNQSQPSPSDGTFTPGYKFCSLVSPQLSPSLDSNQIDKSVHSDHVSRMSHFKNGKRSISLTKSPSSRVSAPASPTPHLQRASKSESRPNSLDFDEWGTAESVQNFDIQMEDEVFQSEQDPLPSDLSMSMDSTFPSVNLLQETANTIKGLNVDQQVDEDSEMHEDEEYEKVTSECLNEIVETIVRMSHIEEKSSTETGQEYDQPQDESLNGQFVPEVTDPSQEMVLIPVSAPIMTVEASPSPIGSASEDIAVSSLTEQITTEQEISDESQDLRSQVALLIGEQTKRTISPSQLSLSTEPSSSSPSPTVSMSPPKDWVLWPDLRTESTPSPNSDDPLIAQLVEPYSEDLSEHEDASVINLMPNVERSSDDEMSSEDGSSLKTADFESSSDDEEGKPRNWLNVSKVDVKSVLRLVALENGSALSGLETVLVFDCIYDEFGRHRHGILDVEAEENCINIYTQNRESSINIKSELEAFNETKHLDFILSAEIVYLNDPVIQFEVDKNVKEEDRPDWIRRLKSANRWNEESEVTWKGSQYISKTKRHRISISVDSKTRSAIEREEGTIRVGDSRISVCDKFDLILCSTCLEYDHKAFDMICSGFKRCQFCSKRHRGECLFEDEPDQWFCHLCQCSGHSVLSKDCPKLIEKLKSKLEAIDHRYKYIILGKDRIC